MDVLSSNCRDIKIFRRPCCQNKLQTWIFYQVEIYSESYKLCMTQATFLLKHLWRTAGNRYVQFPYHKQLLGHWLTELAVPLWCTKWLTGQTVLWNSRVLKCYHLWRMQLWFYKCRILSLYSRLAHKINSSIAYCSLIYSCHN